MDKDFQIVYEEKPEQSAWGIIGRGINSYNAEQAGDEKAQRICYVLQGPDQEIIGGVIGAVYWDWLYVDLMWLPDEFRGQGYGHRLLTLLEEEARKRGAKYAFLDTFSFQAPNFYKQHGYQVFGQLENFPASHTRYYLTKEL